MPRPLRNLLALSVVLLVSAAAAVRSPGETPEVTAELRSRWGALTEGERDRLRERYVEFNQLDPSEKESVHRRAQRLDELARQLYRSLDDEDRGRLDALGVEKRREILREMAVESASEQGQRIMALLPSRDRDRLLRATPEDRKLFFLDFEKRQARRLDEVIQELGPQYLEEMEPARLNRLGAKERREKFLEIFKNRIVRWVANRGLPEELPKRHWSAMARMAPHEFRLAWERARKKYGVEGLKPRKEAKDPLRRLIGAMQADQEGARLELSSLEPRERRAQLHRLQQSRILAVAKELNEEGLLRDDELAGLVEAGGSERFHGRLRQLVSELGRDE